MQTLYYNGTILTMEEGTPQPEALLVGEDGRIQALGSRSSLADLVNPDCRRVDLGGRTLLPGFIDGHSHFTSYANTLGLADLSGAGSVGEILRRLEDFAKEQDLAPGDWLVGFGYDHNLLAGGEHPTRQDLDRVAGEHPVMVTHASGHMGAVNTRALALAGITASTQDPQGGVIGREAGGAPNGYLEEAAFMAVGRQVPPPSPQRVLALLDQAQDIYLRHGITTVQEGLTGQGELVLLKQMAQAGCLRVDVAAYVDLDKAPNLAQENPTYLMGYRQRLKIGGYKIFLDGSPQGRTAWLTQPYEGAEDGYRGYPIHTDERVAELVRTAFSQGRQLLCHCNGDAAAEQFITAVEAVRREGFQKADLRPVMIHAQTVRVDQLDRMRAAGILPSYFVAHTYYWGDVHLQNLGRRAETISPLRSTVRRGMPFTLHQDSPVLPPDMIDTLWCAVNRRTRAGALLSQEEAVTPYQALLGITAYGAYQYFEEGEKGTLQTGKRADLVILSQNPLTTPLDALRGIRVLETIKDGKTVYQGE